MNCVNTDLDGLYIIENFFANDLRGEFVKDFNEELFLSNGLCVCFKEMYHSKSYKNVIRGMHFQIPPHEHTKLVNVVQGSILDVVIDLRADSKTKGQFRVFELNDQNHKSLYIPKGFAHGFLSLEDNTIVSYKVTSVYNQISDCGLRYDSFGYDWMGIKNPVVSDRDLEFASLNQILQNSYF